MRRIAAGIHREDGLISITEVPETDPLRTADLHLLLEIFSTATYLAKKKVSLWRKGYESIQIFIPVPRRDDL